MKLFTVYATALVAALALSGCYTVLMAPASHSSEPPVYSTTNEPETVDVRSSDLTASSPVDPYGYEPYGSGYPIFGFSSPYDAYGFGSPYAYGPSYGYGRSSYGYGPAYGPYGYGYDPYYRGTGGNYIPPGYELVTSRELDDLRANAVLGSGPSSVPTLDEAELRMQRQQSSERAWTQRTVPTTRRSTSTYTTPRPAPTTTSSRSTGTVDSGSSKPSSSSSKSSGSSAAKRRKKRR
jgi:hypothetical protein